MKLFQPVLFRNGLPVADMALGSSDLRRTFAAHDGHFALHEGMSDGSHVLVRDLLGVQKLFFAIDDGRVESSNYLVDLLRAGHPFENVFSVPAGHYVRVHSGDRRYELVRWGHVRFEAQPGGPQTEWGLERYAGSIRGALERTFRGLAQRFAGRPVYVTLSGGLDSTTIAALASEVFPGLHAVTFALDSPREVGQGSDLSFARRVATDLGLPHLEVLADPGEVLELLDEELVYGQDYRDFNVHCGLVNAALGRAIGAHHPAGPRPVVLSGDGMNELLADHVPVHFRGREYFGLPKLDRGLIRRHLVGGLDAGDREVGIFAHFGVETVKPYALCAQDYAALPSQLACEGGSKSRLARAMWGRRILDCVLARPKVRAQVAVEGEPGGTFAMLVSRGIDQENLKERFARRLEIDPHAVGNLTRAGRYRFSMAFPEPSTQTARAQTLHSGA